jgi:hypothetical protein
MTRVFSHSIYELHKSNINNEKYTFTAVVCYQLICLIDLIFFVLLTFIESYHVMAKLSKQATTNQATKSQLTKPVS